MATSLSPPRRTNPKFQLTGRVEITVLRSSPGTYVDGYWVPGALTEMMVEGNIQPLKGTDLLALPESDRTKESIKVYTVETLRTTEEVGQEEADIVIWNDKKFKASKTMTYQMGVLDHTKTICLRLPFTPDDQATYVEDGDD